METKKELINKLNEFKGKCNKDRILIEDFNNQLEKSTDIKLPNIINIYRDKVLELNDIFNEKGVNYFSSDCYLRVLTNIYLNVINCKLYTNLIDLILKIKKYNFYSIFSVKFEDKLYDKKVEMIKSDLDLIKEFDILDYPELLETIIYSDNFLSDLLPDCYLIFVKEIFREMEQLGIDYSNIDKEKLVKIITYKEEKSKMLFDEDKNKRIEMFNKFKEENDINIDSDYQLYNNYILKK